MFFDCFDGYHMGRGGFGYNGLMMLLIIALVVVVVFMLFKKDSSIKSEGDHAIKLLDEKFVNGELTEEEYIHRKKLLKK